MRRYQLLVHFLQHDVIVRLPTIFFIQNYRPWLVVCSKLLSKNNYLLGKLIYHKRALWQWHFRDPRGKVCDYRFKFYFILNAVMFGDASQKLCEALIQGQCHTHSLRRLRIEENSVHDCNLPLLKHLVLRFAYCLGEHSFVLSTLHLSW